MSDITLAMLTRPFLGWYIVEMKAKEDYNGLFETTLLCYTDNRQEVDLVEQEVFWMIDGSGEGARFMGGIIQSVVEHEDRDSVYNKHYYTLHITNALGPLQANKMSRSWVDKTVIEVIQDVLNSPYFEIDFTRCLKDYEKLDYVVQYEQSDYSFVQVLCAEHGLFYYQTIDSSRMPRLRINFADHFASYHAKEINLYVPSAGENRIQMSAARNHFDFIEQNQPIFDVSCSTKAVPNVFLGDDYDLQHAELDLSQSYTNTHGVATVTPPVDVFPLGQLKPDAANKHMKLVANQQAHQQMQWHFKTEDKHFCLGKVFEIKQEAMANGTPEMPGDMLSIYIEHTAKDYSHLQDAENEVPYSLLGNLYQESSQFYENKVTALEWKLEPYIPLLDPKHKAKMPSLLTGVVVGNRHLHTAATSGGPVYILDGMRHLYPDKLGRIKVAMSWDINNKAEQYDFCSWMRVATRQNGITYLPHVGDEVLVAPVDGRPDRFIVLGSAYNSKASLPFDLKNNKALAGIKTSGRKGNNPHYFYGDQTWGKERIVMQSFKDYNEDVGNAIDPYRDPNKQCRFIKQVAENFSQFVHGDMTVEATDGSITINATEAMVFYVGSSQLELLPDRMNLYGDEIEIETLLGKNGPLVTITKEHKCPKRNADGKKHVGGKVITGSSDVFFGDHAAARKGDMVQCKDNSKHKINHGKFGITINGQHAVVVGHQTEHGGEITTGVANILATQGLSLGLGSDKVEKNYNIQVKFKLVASSDYDPVITHAMLNLDAHDDENTVSHPDNPTDQLRGETVISDVSGGDYDIRLSPQNRELAIYNVNGQPCFPYYKATVKVPDGANPDDKTITSDRQFECKVLWPIMMLNCRTHGHGYEQAKAAGASDELDPLDIQYFKKNGKNVTVFVHGYNVNVGELGDEYAESKGWTEFWRDIEVATLPLLYLEETKAKQVTALKKTSYKASIFRDVNIVGHQLNQQVPDDYKPSQEKEDALFNGSGSFNWAINMENTLNEAAGADFTQAVAYEKYTRCLHVTWSGNWGDQNYGEAADQALSGYEARRFATALVRLKKAGLEVNIIAHSLGNGFLLETMKILAAEHPGVVMDHVFMWEAAVPHNVFNRPALPNHQVDRWDYKQSLDAVKKVTLLHSYNDNILGPFAAHDKQKAKLADVYRAKPAVEWFSAYCCKLFNLESLYLVAMGLQVETHLILKPETQEVTYQHLLQYHQHLVAKNASLEDDYRDFEDGKYMPTFAQQMCFVSQTDHYQSLERMMKQGIKQFAADWKDQSSHLHYYLNLHPEIKKYIEPLACVFDAAIDAVYLIKKGDNIVECFISIAQWIERLLAAILTLGTIFAPEIFIPIDIQVLRMVLSFDEVCASDEAAEFASKQGVEMEEVEQEVAEEPEEVKQAREAYEQAKEEGKSQKFLNKAYKKYEKAKKGAKKYHKTYKDAKKTKNAVKEKLLYELKKHHIMGAAYLVHMLTDKRINAMHVPALGYAPDTNDYLRTHTDKFTIVNQTEWLFQHSGMKIPSKDLMTNIIEPFITNKKQGMKNFGKYY